jgi:hypothetical protein
LDGTTRLSSSQQLEHLFSAIPETEWLFFVTVLKWQDKYSSFSQKSKWGRLFAAFWRGFPKATTFGAIKTADDLLPFSQKQPLPQPQRKPRLSAQPTSMQSAANGSYPPFM